MTGSEVERKLRLYAIERGCRFYKLDGPNDVGKPDRVVLCNGITIYVEFKGPTEALSIKQKREHQRIRDAYGVVCVGDNLEDGKNLIDWLLLQHPGTAASLQLPNTARGTHG